MWPMPLPRLLSGVESNSRCCVRAADVEPAMRDALEASGFIAFAGIDSRYTCSDCDEGSCPVIPVGEREDGTTIYHVICQRGDVVTTDDRALASWQYSAHSTADALARLLGVSQVATTIIPQRLWSLGASVFAGVSVSWFVAAGTTQPDARTVFRQAHALLAAPQAVVLTPALSPPTDLLGESVLCWPFAPLLRVAHGEVRFTPDALEVLAREIVTRAQRPSGVKPKARKWLDVPAGTTWDQVVITFENTDAITIQAPGIPHGETLTYDDLGFWDDRSSDPSADRFVQDKYWSRFMRFAFLYLPSEQVSKQAWADGRPSDVAGVKGWVKVINQRLNAVVHGIASEMAPIEGKRGGIYTANFRVVHGAYFQAEMQRVRFHDSGQ